MLDRLHELGGRLASLLHRLGHILLTDTDKTLLYTYAAIMGTVIACC